MHSTRTPTPPRLVPPPCIALLHKNVSHTVTLCRYYALAQCSHSHNPIVFFTLAGCYRIQSNERLLAWGEPFTPVTFLVLTCYIFD